MYRYRYLPSILFLHMNLNHGQDTRALTPLSRNSYSILRENLAVAARGGPRNAREDESRHFLKSSLYINNSQLDLT